LSYQIRAKRGKKWYSLTIRNSLLSFLRHGKIITTKRLAVGVKKEADCLINDFLTKGRSFSTRRLPFDKRVLLPPSPFSEFISKLSGDSRGGYVRKIRVGRRKGDNAELYFLIFVEIDQGKKKVS